jgi:hypothetical protein
MANIKRTTRDSEGNFLYHVLMTHPSHGSAAGKFRTGVEGALIVTNKSDARVTTVACPSGDIHTFEEV